MKVDSDVIKTTIRVPRDVLHEAQYRLKQEGKSVNSFVVEQLEELLEDAQSETN